MEALNALSAPQFRLHYSFGCIPIFLVTEIVPDQPLLEFPVDLPEQVRGEVPVQTDLLWRLLGLRDDVPVGEAFQHLRKLFSGLLDDFIPDPVQIIIFFQIGP